MRVSEAIDRANADGRAAFVGYLPLGYPDLETSIEAAVTLAENGVDVLELGPPYTDPVMDGAVIQEATNEVLEHGFHTDDVFRAIKEITRRTDAAVVVMSYWNLILQHGVAAYGRDLKASGGAGLVTPDITPDSASEWIEVSDSEDLERIFLAAPTSTDERLKMISEASRGFVYAVSTMGITGERQDLDQAARSLVGRLRAQGAERVCVGIGISSADHVRQVSQYADGAIVGTALVRALRDGGINGLGKLARELAEGTSRTS